MSRHQRVPQYQIRPHYPRPPQHGGAPGRAAGGGHVKVIASPKVCNTFLPLSNAALLFVVCIDDKTKMPPMK